MKSEPSLINGRTNGKAIVNFQAEELSLHRSKNHTCKKLLNPYSV